jgi:hypothetical protein
MTVHCKPLAPWHRPLAAACLSLAASLAQAQPAPATPPAGSPANPSQALDCSVTAERDDGKVDGGGFGVKTSQLTGTPLVIGGAKVLADTIGPARWVAFNFTANDLSHLLPEGVRYVAPYPAQSTAKVIRAAQAPQAVPAAKLAFSGSYSFAGHTASKAGVTRERMAMVVTGAEGAAPAATATLNYQDTWLLRITTRGKLQAVGTNVSAVYRVTANCKLPVAPH